MNSMGTQKSFAIFFSCITKWKLNDMVYECFSKYLFKRHKYASPKASNIEYFLTFMCDYMVHTLMLKKSMSNESFQRMIGKGRSKRGRLKYPLLTMYNYYRPNSEQVAAFKLPCTLRWFPSNRRGKNGIHLKFWIYSFLSFWMQLNVC